MNDPSKKILSLATIGSGEEQQASKTNICSRQKLSLKAHPFSVQQRSLLYTGSSARFIWPGHEPNKYLPKRVSDYILPGSWKRPIQVRWSKPLFPWTISVPSTIFWVFPSLFKRLYNFYIYLFSTLCTSQL